MQNPVLGWSIVALGTAGVILRPWKLPEAVWAVSSAVLLVLLGLLSWQHALTGVAQGLDVYMFLTGMMLLSELARREGVFDWLAALTTRAARGSPLRLFVLLYLLGTVVTVFLSNDATAVVLTPAVYAAAHHARVRDPLPYLLICAFIANAASFVLPISNPANLVVFGGHMPPLAVWLRLFALPSLAAVILTFAALWMTQRRALARDSVADDAPAIALRASGRIAAGAIIFSAVALMLASAFGYDLGAPTLACGLAAMAIIAAATPRSPWPALRDISWGVLPLVAGLFVFVSFLADTGVTALLAAHLRSALQAVPGTADFGAGATTAIASNLANNLPVGLVAGHVVQAAQADPQTAAAILIGVDLGPNLSVTGSLATILWLTALRREGLTVSAWAFLKIGVVVMPAALIAALLLLRL